MEWRDAFLHWTPVPNTDSHRPCPRALARLLPYAQRNSKIL
jgi:hypothetical protein